MRDRRIGSPCILSPARAGLFFLLCVLARKSSELLLHSLLSCLLAVLVLSAKFTHFIHLPV